MPWRRTEIMNSGRTLRRLLLVLLVATVLAGCRRLRLKAPAPAPKPKPTPSAEFPDYKREWRAADQRPKEPAPYRWPQSGTPAPTAAFGPMQTREQIDASMARWQRERAEWEVWFAGEVAAGRQPYDGSGPGQH